MAESPKYKLLTKLILEVSKLESQPEFSNIVNQFKNLQLESIIIKLDNGLQTKKFDSYFDSFYISKLVVYSNYPDELTEFEVKQTLIWLCMIKLQIAAFDALFTKLIKVLPENFMEIRTSDGKLAGDMVVCTDKVGTILEFNCSVNSLEAAKDNRWTTAPFSIALEEFHLDYDLSEYLNNLKKVLDLPFNIVITDYNKSTVYSRTFHLNDSSEIIKWVIENGYRAVGVI